MSSYIKRLITIILILFIALIAFNSFTYVTKENEYKVVKQFGEIKKISSTTGLSFKTPFIQTVSTIPKEVQLYDIAESDVITSDKKTMIVDAYVLWRVTDPKKFTQTLNANITTAQSRLDVIVYNSIKTTISSMTQESVIESRDNSIKIVSADTKLDDIEINDIQSDEIVKESDLIKEEEQSSTTSTPSKSLSSIFIEETKEACSDYGIEIVKIAIKKLDLPNENKSSVYTRMITERENIAAAYTAQGQSAAQIIKNQTDKEISIMLSEAKATAEQTIAEGEAEYMRILSDAYNDESKASFYRYVRALESAKSSLKNGENTLILSKDSPIAQIFNGN